MYNNDNFYLTTNPVLGREEQLSRKDYKETERVPKLHSPYLKAPCNTISKYVKQAEVLKNITRRDEKDKNHKEKMKNKSMVENKSC